MVPALLAVAVTVTSIVAIDPQEVRSAAPSYHGLPISPRNVCIKLLSSADASGALNFANDHPLIDPGVTPVAIAHGFFVYALTSSVDAELALDSLRRSSDVAIANPALLGRDGSDVYMTDQIIVKWRKEVSGQLRDSLNEQLTEIAEQPDPERPHHQFVRMRGGSETTALDVSDEFVASGLCEWAKPNLIWRPILNDVSHNFWPRQWNYRRNGIDSAGIDADSAWYLSKGSSNVTVAVIDIGFPWDSINGRVDHEDLSVSNPILGWDVVGESFADPLADSNPYFPCSGPPPWVDRPCNCSHGIEVLGLIAADQSDTIGIRGLAPKCDFVAIKVLDDNNGWTTDSLFAEAFRYAWQTAGAQVVSISIGATPDVYGGWSDTTKSWIWYDELYLMYQNGITVCAAAGNLGGDVEPPADGAGVFAVGATDSADALWFYSAHGGRLDFVAPAGGHPADRTDCPDSLSNFWTLDVMGDSGYVPDRSGGECGDSKNYECRGTGTSVAAPEVAGLSALILSRRSDFISSGDPRAIVFDIIKNTCDDLGAQGPDDDYGYGRINVFRAMCAVSRGDCNWDGLLNVSDCVLVFDEVFRGGSAPALFAGLSDVNCDGNKSITDYTLLYNHVFRSGDPPGVCYEFSY